MVNRSLAVALAILCASICAPAQSSEADRQLFKATLALANQGDAAAQLAVGNLYFAGTGVSRNLRKGAKWHQKAAEQGLAAAQYQLALDYRSGDGVEAEPVEAAGWFRRAAQQGMEEAQVELGLCHLRGEGVIANSTEAVEWFRRAVAQGSVEAAYQLGRCYLEGAGVSRDIDQALVWIRQAAERAFAPAQKELGQCYEKGLGLPKDPLQAYKWFALAAARDDAHALDIRVSMAKMEVLLSKEQVAEAQRLAREFKPVNTPLSETPAPVANGPGSVAGSLSATGQPAATGVVNVTADDEQSEIFADGAFVGHSPARLTLKEGPHVIEVKRPGYKGYLREIVVTTGSDLNLRVTLQKE